MDHLSDFEEIVPLLDDFFSEKLIQNMDHLYLSDPGILPMVGKEDECVFSQSEDEDESDMDITCLSNEQELKILKAALDAKNSPNLSIYGYYFFKEMKGALQLNITEAKLKVEFYKLIQKYTNEHYINCFEIAQKIWGDDSSGNDNHIPMIADALGGAPNILNEPRNSISKDLEMESNLERLEALHKRMTLDLKELKYSTASGDGRI